ncbi:FecR family protein [uncultured Chitinophaga sp.]|jgi:Fe2+-dicitrate sensor, membrane component|uniref:FecR family protein n=1 Tax=uncultured Chitinophaga sp. TaxID=339340 RepID=UPI00260DA382|nr:FecR family protein [uncultured Chitinophaga sp.]
MEYNSEDIHILLIEKISGDINPADEALVDRLIRDDPSIAEAWTALQATFSTPEGREALDPARHEAFAEKVLTTLEQRQRKQRRRYYDIGWAAAILLLLVASLQWPGAQRPPSAPAPMPAARQEVCLQLGNGRLISLGDNSPQHIPLKDAYLRRFHDTLTFTAAGNKMVNTLIVPPGKDYTLLLSDGTEIRLNAGTTLSFPFSFPDNKREVSINGEAYFRVAKKAGQPFIVYTPQSVIEVLGTSFNVNTYQRQRTTVSLLEGVVKIKAGNDVQLLQPGTQAVCLSHQGMEIRPFNKTETFSWLKGEYLFHDTPLQEIARVIPCWYGVDVVLDHPGIVNKRFSGVIHKNKPLAVFIEHLQRTSGLRFEYKGSVLHIK